MAVPESVCPSCGARLEEDASICELCGTPADLEETPPVEALPEVTLPVCPTCGWENPADARFCNQCGSRLREGRPARPRRSESEQAVQRTLWWTGGAVLLVFLVYAGLQLSGFRRAPDAAPSTEAQVTTSATPEPIPEDMAAQVRELEKAIAQAPDAETRRAYMRNLVVVLAQAQLFVRAAQYQEQIAEQEQTAEAWALAGNLYYDAMQSRQGTARVELARKAIAAYQRSLELNPDNLDVRTDMAVAYLNDPEQPMEAIRQINIVLERDPDHLQANFNKAIMLAQIGRIPQALEHLEKVRQLSEPGSEPYERATQLIEALKSSTR